MGEDLHLFWRQLPQSQWLAGGGGAPYVPVDTTAAPLIPDPKQCVKGVGPNKCVFVEPLTPPEATKTDGLFGKDEYYMATEMEFANTGVPGTGRMSATVGQGATSMRLFFKDLPLPPTANRVFVALDFSRNEPNEVRVGAGDFGFELDLDSKTQSNLVPVGFGGNTRWAAASAQADFPKWIAKASNRRKGSNGLQRADVEFEISTALFWGTTSKSVGIMVGTSLAQGADVPAGTGLGIFPEQYEQFGIPALWTQIGTPFVDRDRFQTLLVGRAAPQPLTYMSWNVKRFTKFLTLVEPSDDPNILITTNISNDDIGKYIGERGADIVGLQEVWKAGVAEELAAAANKVRDQLGLPPYQVILGPEFAPRILSSLPEGPDLRPDQTNGGLVILTSQAVLQTGTTVYSSCRGEDCFKARGALWARISTDRPQSPACAENGTCTMPPSGDHYVDVFNTHLNSPEPYLCKPGATTLMVASYALFPPLFLSGLNIVGYACGRSQATVQASQVEQLSTFIDSAADPSRPSVVMGDFNISGKNLTDVPYQNLLRQLKIAPVTVDPTFPAPDDMLNQWPTKWKSDIDHGDLAREDSSQWSPGDGTDLGALWTENSPESDRFDYIFVRNPVDRATLQSANRRYMFAKTPGQPVWAAPWPGPSDRSSRLSDHKPLLASLILAPYFIPGAYHPSWEQSLQFRVSSYDTTGIEDCWGCDELDVYTKFAVKSEAAGAWSTIVPEKHTGICQDAWARHYSPGSCMNDWFWDARRTTDVTRHRTTLQLWDDDDYGNPDDRYAYTTDSFGDPHYEFVWATGSLNSVTNVTGALVTPNVIKFRDSSPHSYCSRTTRANLCLRLTLREVSPYP